ncbi:helix-turn-helix domain-containing protein [Streptomyces sp. SCSIO ZS0520]|uniref:helix-turn-helix domain-containing protein n=1 Tax=Streptomyces sp. SCSIO ZS0520 TaxID=2892996 RepID=UPI0021D840EB|nr:helix-turn-helix transcriptional regulator [Streptomyces sp. SCSIO ZS0520]
MKRTGTGERLTVRGLALRADLSNGTISGLCTGAQRTLPAAKAERLAEVIGVDVLVLFIPGGRAARAAAAIPTPRAVPA